VKAAVFHPKALVTIREFPEDVRRGFGKAIFDLQKGEKLSMPLSRPMNLTTVGVEELRIKDRSGAYRGFLLRENGRFSLDLPCVHEENPEDSTQ
jgi:phage-related protein